MKYKQNKEDAMKNVKTKDRRKGHIRKKQWKWIKWRSTTLCRKI